MEVTSHLCISVVRFKSSKSVEKIVNPEVMIDSGSGCLDLRAKIRILVEKWRSKTSKQKFLVLYWIPRKMFEIVGVRVYGDCRLNLFSHFGNVLVAYYLSMVSYTIYYWTRKGQVVFGLRCLCGMGIMVSVNCNKWTIFLGSIK